MIFEDDVPTVSLNGDRAEAIRSWCQDSTWKAPRPPLSRIARARLRLSLFLEELANWVMP